MLAHEVPNLLLLLLCFCAAQKVAIGTWDLPVRGSVATAATCRELEALFHEASVKEIVVVERIVAKECGWRREMMPKRCVSWQTREGYVGSG